MLNQIFERIAHLAEIVHTHTKIFALGRARLGVLCGEKRPCSVDSSAFIRARFAEAQSAS
jgi:hypothetical protein